MVLPTLLVFLMAGLASRRAVGADPSATTPNAGANSGATPAAFSALLDQCDLAQPLFVRVESSGGTSQVNFYSIPPHEFARSLKSNTDPARRVATVSMTAAGLTVDLNPQAESGNQAGPAGSPARPGLAASRAALSAIAFLQGLGYLRSEFRIRVTIESDEECRVEVVDFPLRPGGHKTIYVTKSGLRMIPGA